MNIIFLFFLLFVCACSSGKNSQEKKLTKKHYYTKKYSTLLVSDLVVGYTCKNVLHFGIPACIALDAAGDAGVITYQTKKYQKKS